MKFLKHSKLQDKKSRRRNWSSGKSQSIIEIRIKKYMKKFRNIECIKNIINIIKILKNSV